MSTNQKQKQERMNFINKRIKEIEATALDNLALDAKAVVHLKREHRHLVVERVKLRREIK